jgi:AcrR family transcriptional regulator
VAKRGYHDTSTELIVRRAKVGYATFYKNFSDKEDCFLTLFDEAFAGASRAVIESFKDEEEQRPWAERVVSALRTLFELIAADPPLSRACLVESLTAGPVVMARYDKTLRELGRILLPGREIAEHGDKLPMTLEDTLAGGILWIAYERLVVGEATKLPGLLPEAVQFVLNPYLGEDEAIDYADQCRTAEVAAS